MEAILSIRACTISSTIPQVLDRTDVVLEVGDRVVAIWRLYVADITCLEWVGNLGCTYLVRDTPARTFLHREKLLNGCLQRSELTNRSVACILQVGCVRLVLVCQVLKTCCLYCCEARCVRILRPCNLQLIYVVNQVLDYCLCILQLLRTLYICKAIVCIVTLELSNLTWLSITEEDKLKCMETKDRSILKRSITKLTCCKVAVEECTVQWPRVDVWVNIEV